jgi:hypothetical protein
LRLSDFDGDLSDLASEPKRGAIVGADARAGILADVHCRVIREGESLESAFRDFNPEKVSVTPAKGGGIEIVAKLASMVEAALSPDGGSANAKTALRDAERRSANLVAGAGFEPATFRL